MSAAGRSDEVRRRAHGRARTALRRRGDRGRHGERPARPGTPCLRAASRAAGVGVPRRRSAPRARRRHRARSGTAARGSSRGSAGRCARAPAETFWLREREIRRILLQDRRHRVRGRVAAERAPAREHLVEDRAEGEDVAARVGRLARGPARATCSRAFPARRRARCRRSRSAGWTCAAGRLVRRGSLARPKSRILTRPSLRDEDVLGLQVPVDDALLVRRREAVRDLGGVFDGSPRREALRPRARARSVSPSSSSWTT